MSLKSTFFEITPSSWDQAKEIGNLLTQCVFRGHEDNTWNLSTTIERAAHQFSCPPDSLWQQEKFIINEFRSRAHHYISAPPKDNEFVEWISLVQHHGGPTRLLDFTKSFYIASFFAVETAKQDACVWGVNYFIPVGKAIAKDLYVYQKQVSLLHSHLLSENLVESFIADKTKKLDLVIRVEPYRKNERLAIQKGTFLFPFNITKTFEQNLCTTFDFPFDKLSYENATKVKFKDLKNVTSGTVGVIKINGS